MLPCVGRRSLLLLFRQIATVGDPFRSPHPHAILSYSTTPLTTDPDPSPTVSYLVACCGLSPAAAATTSRNLRINSFAKADAVRALLRRHGFSDADIAKMVRHAPQLLVVDPDKILQPKLDFFATLGFSGPALLRILASVPLLLARSLDKHLVPCFDFLRGIVGTEANVRAAVSRIPRALQVDLNNVMRPAVEALRHHGLSEDAISRLVVIQMGVLMMAPDRIGEIIEDLEALGLPMNDTRFLYGFRVLCSLKRETLQRKIALYKSFGLSESEVLKAFKTQPTILLFAEENIEKKIRFFLDELKLDLGAVMGRPVVLALSLEKNVLPRCAVLSVLMREGKIGRDINLLRPLLYSTRVFKERYVTMFEKDVPDVLKAYEGKIKFKDLGIRLWEFHTS